jgi:RNA polymerase sigma-B factor
MAVQTASQTLPQQPARAGISDAPTSAPGTQTELQRRDRHSAELLSRTPDTEQERRANIDQAVEINLSIADTVARRYAGRGVDADDLTQVARLGLVQAARRFDPSNGDFHSFAIPTVTGEVKRYFRDQGWSIRPPRRLQELRHDIAVAWPYLAQEKARTPDTMEIADRLDASRDDVTEALSEGTFRLSSLDAPGLAAADRVGQPDDGFSEIDDAAERDGMMRSVQEACRQLSDSDLEVLRMRYVQGCTQAVIASQFRVSQMSISRRLSRIIQTLQSLVAAQQGPTPLPDGKVSEIPAEPAPAAA